MGPRAVGPGPGQGQRLSRWAGGSPRWDCKRSDSSSPDGSNVRGPKEHAGIAIHSGANSSEKGSSRSWWRWPGGWQSRRPPHRRWRRRPCSHRSQARCQNNLTVDELHNKTKEYSYKDIVKMSESHKIPYNNQSTGGIVREVACAFFK